LDVNVILALPSKKKKRRRKTAIKNKIVRTTHLLRRVLDHDLEEQLPLLLLAMHQLQGKRADLIDRRNFAQIEHSTAQFCISSNIPVLNYKNRSMRKSKQTEHTLRLSTNDSCIEPIRKLKH
jgi:hypothetical protein